jgi:hypothetical protein
MVPTATEKIQIELLSVTRRSTCATLTRHERLRDPDFHYEEVVVAATCALLLLGLGLRLPCGLRSLAYLNRFRYLRSLSLKLDADWHLGLHSQ